MARQTTQYRCLHVWQTKLFPSSWVEKRQPELHTAEGRERNSSLRSRQHLAEFINPSVSSFIQLFKSVSKAGSRVDVRLMGIQFCQNSDLTCFSGEVAVGGIPPFHNPCPRPASADASGSRRDIRCSRRSNGMADLYQQSDGVRRQQSQQGCFSTQMMYSRSPLAGFSVFAFLKPDHPAPALVLSDRFTGLFLRTSPYFWYREIEDPDPKVSMSFLKAPI